MTGPSAPAGTAPRRIRVAFADDSYLIREAIALLLSREPRVAVVALCEDGDALRAAIDAEHPDVVLTDIRMPPSGDAEGIVLAKWLRVTHPDIGVVVLSQYLDPAHGLALLEDGYDRRGYLLKERLKHGAQLVAALEVVAAGGSVVDPAVAEALIPAQARAAESPLSALSEREWSVLDEIAQGKSNQVIADELSLSKRVVEKEINAIYHTLGLARAEDVSRRVKAALIYLARRPPGESQRARQRSSSTRDSSPSGDASRRPQTLGSSVDPTPPAR